MEHYLSMESFASLVCALLVDYVSALGAICRLPAIECICFGGVLFKYVLLAHVVVHCLLYDGCISA